MDQMKIVVGSLICQPDPEKQKGIEDRIGKLEDVLDDHSEEHLMFLEMLKNHTESQIDIQVEINEEQPSAYQGKDRKI